MAMNGSARLSESDGNELPVLKLDTAELATPIGCCQLEQTFKKDITFNF
jgi:hypothetical protein